MTDFSLFVLQVAAVNVLLALALSLHVDGFGSVVFHLVGISGIAAYTFAILTTRIGAPVEISIGCAISLGALVGWISAKLIRLLRGDGLTLATFALGVTFFELFRYASFTGGVFGIAGIPRWGVGSGPLYRILLPITCCVAACSVVCAWRHSLARAFATAIRTDEWAAASLGVRLFAHQGSLGTIAGGIAGLAGATFAGINGFVEPRDFRATMILTAFAAVIAARGRTPFGVALAAVGIVAFTEGLRFVGSTATIAGPVSEIILASLIGGTIVAVRVFEQRSPPHAK